MSGWFTSATPDWAGLAGQPSGLVRWGATPDEVARHGRGQLLYLASPLSHRATEADGSYSRVGAAVAALDAGAMVAQLLARGLCVVSPVVQLVEVCTAGRLRRSATLDPLDAAFWEVANRPLLAASYGVVVPEIDGWDESLGVWGEVRFAVTHGMPVWLYAEGL